MFDRKQFLESLSHNNRPTSVDAEGRIWVWHEESRMYEQMNTGVMLNEQQYNARNIEIIGYYDGGGPVAKIVVNYNTNSDGIFGRTGPTGPSSIERIYNIFSQPTSGFGLSADILLVQGISGASGDEIRLREGSSGGEQDLLPAPSYIGFYVEGPTAGWFIGKNAHVNGNTYDFVRSSNGETDYPPRGLTLDKPTAIAFYANDPGDPNQWSSYTLPAGVTL
jgi:hypothetical protein